MIIVLRHAQEEEPERLHGWEDVVLTELGHRQAAVAAEALEGLRFDRALSSDLDRALMTAAPVVAKHEGLELEWSTPLRSMNLGELVKLPPAECRAAYDALLLGWRNNPDLAAPGGESFSQFQNRLLGLLNAVRTAPGNTLLVTHSHNCALIAGWAANMGQPLAGDGLKLLETAVVRVGNVLMLDDRLRMVELNAIRQAA